MLLAHGFTATPVEVRGLAARLHERGYTVAAPLLPGHGTTPQDLNRTRWQAWAATAEAAYRDLCGRCERVFVGGESMGALAALYVAADHPEAAGVLAYAPAMQLPLSGAGRVLLQVLAPIVPWRRKPGLDEERAWQGYRVDPLRGAVQLLRFQEAVRERLHRIRQPVLVVQGAFDKTIHPRSGEIILDGVQSTLTEHHWMPESSHVVLLGPELEKVTAVTVAFMERALGAAVADTDRTERGGDDGRP